MARWNRLRAPGEASWDSVDRPPADSPNRVMSPGSPPKPRMLRCTQRRAPTGGAAYGMPRNSFVAATVRPRTVPPAVATTRGVTGFVLALGPALLPAPEVAVALVHAAAAISTAVAAAPAASPVRTRCP